MEKKLENKQKVLITDDNEMNRAILAEMLEDDYDIIEASDGKQAVTILQQHSNEIDLLLLDIVMPEMDGFEVLVMMNKYHWIDDVPVIMISAENASSNVERAYELGVTDYISRPFDVLIVRRRVVNTIMLYAKQKKLIGLVTDQIYEKEKSNNLMINILSHIVEFRNGESGLHVLHIHTMTEMILQHLQHKTDKYPLTSREISMIATASALHDIGKIGVPDSILNKPGKFTPEEFTIMKGHSALGASMLEKIPYQHEEPLVKVAYSICRWHHERYDGRGYPDGLKGEEIPIEAQVVALADVYDALTSERVYKKAIPHKQAVEMILNGECGAFNPLLLECLVEMADSIQKELKVNSINRENQKQMKNVAQELLRHEELTASERTLRLLEHERMKYRFFASMSKEIQFEYTVAPPMVSISDWGVEKLGLDEITMDPLNSEKVLNSSCGENLKKLSELVHIATPENPVVQFDCKIKINQQERWNRITCRAMWSGEPQEYVGVIGKVTDIQDERDHLTNLEYLASHDGLTGLLNHASAGELIRERMETDEGYEFALVIFDLDFFKQANDKYGHAFGNEVLQYVARTLKHSIRGNDIAARVGGDEFLIFLSYNSGIQSIISRIYKTLSGEFKGFKISISMGVANTKPKTGDAYGGGSDSDYGDRAENKPAYKNGLKTGSDYDTLFKKADKALYTVKRGGRGRFLFYDESMEGTFDGSTDEYRSVISTIEG